jgi:hypothetical protein
LVTFTLSGLWHGANWTFIIWGALNGIFQLVEKMSANLRSRFLLFSGLSKIPRIVRLFNILITFVLITITWVFFRADSLSGAMLIFDKILNEGGHLYDGPLQALLYGSFFTLLLIISDVLQERNGEKHFFLENRHAWVRYTTYLSLILIILLFGVFDSSRFIYFQF